MVNVAAVAAGCLVILVAVLGLKQSWGRLGRVGQASSGDLTPVSDLESGTWAHVEGTARQADDEPLPADIAGGEGFVVDTELIATGHAEGGTGTFLRQLHVVPFELDDGTGSVRVEPPEDTMGIPDWMSDGILTKGGDVETTKAEYHVDRTVIEDRDSVPDVVREWTDSQARNFDDFPTSAYRFEQGAVAPGDSLAVYGKVHQYADANPHSPRLKIDGNDEPEQFILTDEGVESVQRNVHWNEYVKIVIVFGFLLFGIAIVGLGLMFG